MIAFPCVGCGHKFKVKDDLAGKKGKCPHCGQSVVIPALPVGKDLPTLPPGATNSGAVKGSVHPASELTAFLAPPQKPDELGRLGSYRVLKVLGAGGMGVVYKAEDPHLERPVALKAILPSCSGSSAARERFLREAKAAAAVKHDHVVTIYQVGEDRGAPFLAMEFLEGQSLDDRLHKKAKLPVAEVLRIGREIAEGLAAAHERGLIHRDIKPANVWLEGPRGRVKILDFGLARAASPQTQLTQAGVILGTPAFMSPEQTRAQNVDHRSDLFSLGCVLYRMCAGELPFKGEDAICTLMAIATETPTPLHILNPQTPPAFVHLVNKLLAKNPDDRPASAQAVAGELAELERQMAAAPTYAAPQPPRQKESAPASQRKGPPKKFFRPGSAKRSPVLLWGVVLLVAIGGGVVAALLFSPGTFRDGKDESLAFFNGKNLDGWEGLPEYWSVKDGALVGAAPKGLERNTYLCTKKSYGNFELKCQVRLIGDKANSGLQFRSVLRDPTKFNVSGPQADMGKGCWGDLWAEGKGEMMKAAPAAEVAETLKPNDFNDYSVRCVGQRVTIKVNGVTAVDNEFSRTDLPEKGILAWQLHARAPLEMTIRNIEFKELPDEERWVPLFDGTTLNGWKVFPKGQGLWKVQDGVITCEGPNSHLFSARDDYENFHIRIEAMINEKGNSGLFFRAPFMKGAIGGNGYEAQIALPGGDKQFWTGSLYKISPVEGLLHEPNEWFTLEVVANGDHILIHVNGKNVVNVRHGKHRKGHFALQHNNEKTVVKFRKIEVKELPSSKP